MKQRKFYEKPSVKRKRKEKEAQRRLANRYTVRPFFGFILSNKNLVHF